MGLGDVISEFGEALITTLVIAVGPWPATPPQPLEKLAHYQAALTRVDNQAARNDLTATPGRFRAGWGKAELTPPVGAPLAGYGARNGGPSTGVHDALWVKALAVGDGKDTAVIVGADMLVVPENIADAVRRQVAEKTGLRAEAILFNATHTHSGAGGGMPGLVPRMFAGPYAPALPALAIKAFTAAIVQAHAAMRPARLAHDAADARPFIRNRTRPGAVDGSLRFLVVEQEGGARCVVVRFSAHATIVGSDNMEFSGDYPGSVQRMLAAETGAECLFLAGAVGSMGPAGMGEGGEFQQCEKLARGLTDLIRPRLAKLKFQEAVDVAAVGVPIYFPSLELRVARNWRLAPLVADLAGVDRDAWVGAVRLGEVVLAGLPADYSGELAVRMAAWGAQTHGVDLWMNSFSGDYLGYISPDAGYQDPFEHPDPRVRAATAYEGQVMSWTGPQQEAIFHGLVQRMVQRLQGAP